MPLYELSVTTTAGAAEGSASTATVEIEEPVIVEGFIFIDPGANGQVEAQLRYGDRPILPHPNVGTVTVPAVRDPSPINVRLPGVPTDIELRAWGGSTSFDHDVIAQFDALSPENVPQEVTVTNLQDESENFRLSERELPE